MAIAFFANAEGRSARQTLLAGVSEAARERDVPVVVHSSPTVSALAKLNQAALEAMYSFRADDFDGIVLAYPHPALIAYGEQLHRRGYPVVNIARPGEVPNVAMNNYAAIRHATEAFAAAGHRQVVFLDGPEENPSARLRRNGFLAGLRAAGLDSTDAVMPGGAFSLTASHDVVRAAWERGARFTALIAANDASAIGALRALREFGVDVPGEVEVLGFDDLPPAKWTSPSLSSFATPEFEMGYRAVAMLLERTGGEVVLPVTFVGRASTRPTTHLETDRVISPPWVAEPTRARRELAFLHRDAVTARALDALQSSDLADDRSLADMAQLIEVCERREVSVGCLYELIEERQRSHQEQSARTSPALSQGGRLHDLLLGALVDEQRRTAEIASEFDVVLRPLRQLALEAAEERNILATFATTLSDLGIRHAELTFRPTKADAHAGEPISYTWRADREKQAAEKHAPARRLAIRDLLSRGGVERGFFVAPLLHNDAQFGLLALDLDCRYRAMYPDLVRQLTIALQTARTSLMLTEAHQRLVESSHFVGMAEVATGVLHNVGNVLNSLNVSVSMLGQGLQDLKVETLEKTMQLLREHRADLGLFLSEDLKGRRVLDLLESLAAAFAADRARLLGEAKAAGHSVDHIKEIVASQQAYATTVRFVEAVEAQSLMEDALRMNFGALLRHNVRIERAYEPVSLIEVEKSKALQILVNLIKNAKQACDEIETGERIITLRIRPVGSARVSLQVTDNGVGIAATDITRLFTHGFTTRSDGHGFGLHFAALAAKGMGGELTVFSAGLGTGATFALELPVSGTVATNNLMGGNAPRAVRP